MNYAGSSSHEGVFLLLRRIPLSQLFSISPLTSYTPSFTPLNSSSHLKYFYRFHFKSCLPKKQQVSPSRSCMLPPGLLTPLLFGSLLHPLTLFPSLYLCLHLPLSLSLTISLYFYSLIPVD